jgi:hypothetical protein
MHTELDVLDRAISHALVRTHLSDRVEVIVNAIAHESSAYTHERLEDVVVYALLEAERQKRSFDCALIRRLIGTFLEQFGDR